MKVQIASPTDETIRAVGERIRVRRKLVGMTLNEVADRTGVSVSMLSMLERGVAGASIGTLVAVSSALGVQMRDLFEEPEDLEIQPVIRRADQTEIETAEGVLRRVAHNAVEHGFEVATNEYAPGTASNEIPVRHDGIEYGLVIEGTLTIELGSETYTLEPGDAISYASTTPHRITNKTDQIVRTVWVNVNS